jgi:hypothetical protein
LTDDVVRCLEVPSWGAQWVANLIPKLGDALRKSPSSFDAFGPVPSALICVW